MLHDLTKGDGYAALKRASEQEGIEIQWNDVRNLLYS